MGDQGAPADFWPCDADVLAWFVVWWDHQVFRFMSIDDALLIMRMANVS